MASLSIKKLVNANVYIDGNSQLGKAEEVTLPELKSKMAEHKALGMVGMIELPSGIEKMEAKIKWNSYYGDLIKKLANPFVNLSMQLRGNLEEWGSAGRLTQVPAVVYLTVNSKNLPGGNFKQHDNVELESDFNCIYYKLEINGEVIFEFDPMSNIYKVAGTDILATYRINLGA